jgi:hypothetical protein
MSFPKDDDWGRDNAMLDGTRKVKPHGEGGGHWPMTPRKLQKALTLEPEHPLKRYLRGWVCYKVVSEWETTLGLLGLTKESSDYFSFLENFKGEGTLPYPI